MLATIGTGSKSKAQSDKCRLPQNRSNSLPQELLVVGQLDHQGHLEGILQILGEHEGDQMPQVQRFAGGSLRSMPSRRCCVQGAASCSDKLGACGQVGITQLQKSSQYPTAFETGF